MHPTPTLFRRAGALMFLLPGLLAALPAPAADKIPASESSEGQWVFSLLPKSFQDNPFVDQTVITEMTAEGRKLPAASPAQPVYYVAQSSGYHEEGPHAGDSPPPPALLENNLKQALAANGYLPTLPGKPPSLLIVYVWGVHNNFDSPGLDDLDNAFPDVKYRNLLSRASLVGGTKFASELKTALDEHDRMNDVTANPLMDPLRLFTERDPKTRQLVEQSKAGCYYLVASAYDYAAGARGTRVLLWRTKMTVDAQGVAMTDTLPALILNAGKYLGRDMPEAATLARRIKRTGKTSLGPLEVKEFLDKLPAPAEKSSEPSPKPAQ